MSPMPEFRDQSHSLTNPAEWIGTMAVGQTDEGRGGEEPEDKNRESAGDASNCSAPPAERGASMLRRLPNAHAALMPLLLQAERHANLHRQSEISAATCIARCFRGFLVRARLQQRAACALYLQRVYRGHLGRRRFAAMHTAVQEAAYQAKLHQCATCVQRYFRGYGVRKHVLDFYRRKHFIDATMAASSRLLHAGLEEARARAESEREQWMHARLKALDKQLKKSAHLRGTRTIAGAVDSKLSRSQKEAAELMQLTQQTHAG